MNRIRDDLSLKEKREKIVELILKKNYGETITNEEINEIMKENLSDEYGRKRFKSHMNKVKNILITKGYVIRCIYNVGYYILMPRQVSSYTYRNFIVRPVKTLNKAKIILDNTKKASFNKAETETYIKTCSLNSALVYATNELINAEEYKILQK